MKHGIAAHNYTMFMIEKYGKRKVDEMLETANKPIKLYAADYREMIQSYNATIRKIRSKLL